MNGPLDKAEIGVILAAHEYAIAMKSGSICSCGFVPVVDAGSLQTQQDYHRSHLAELLTDHAAQVWMDGAFCYGGDAAEQWYFNDGGSACNPYEPSTSPGSTGNNNPGSAA